MFFTLWKLMLLGSDMFAMRDDKSLSGVTSPPAVYGIRL